MAWLILSVLIVGALIAVTGIEQRRLERRFPPIGRFAVVEGTRLHYTDTGCVTGARPVVVLVHGASTSLLDFHASLVEPLAERHRVITLDRPGHGYSERGEAEAWPNPAYQAWLIRGLLAELEVERPVLVGHSWAGSVVLAYLLEFPGAAAGAVLLAGGSHPWEGGVAWYNDLAGVPLVGRLFAYTLPLTAGRLGVNAGIASAFVPNAVPDDYRSRTGVELTLRPRTFLANAEDIRLLSPFLEQQSTRYAAIGEPLLLITGDSDPVVPAWNHTDRLMRLAPAAKREVLEGTGHGLHHVRSERVAALIHDFAMTGDSDRLASRIPGRSAPRPAYRSHSGPPQTVSGERWRGRQRP
jgi:pimeloyl-ACP methyl ester carboxylesterase